jgi:hypothetical protein
MVVRRLAFALALLFVIPSTATVSAQGQAPAASAAAAPADQLLKPEELEALVAPIALYPDSLLALVLMASTYPLEVVQANRWIKQNPNLKGDGQKTELDKQSWDDSIKSLVASPDVLSMMSTKLDWTQKLGDAVLAQHPDVMDAIQRLRARADGAGKLQSNSQQRVTKSQISGGQGSGGQASGGRQYIAIEQTDPDTLYVPYYDPAVAYGGWPYPAYPPYYFGYPGYIGAGLIAGGLAFGAGWALGRWSSGANYWGGNINWNNNSNININRPRVNPLNGSNFQHRPEHRGGVRYNNSNVRQQFGGNRGNAQNRMDFRGRGGNQVVRPGGGQRPGAGQRPSQRPSAGQRPSQRPSAGGRPSQRPSAGQRPSQRTAGQRSGGGRGGNALGNVSSGRAANRHSSRGRASMASGSGMRVGGTGGMRVGGGGGFRGGGGGGFRGGGGGGFRGGGGRGGGGRRSDIALKHDIVLLGHLDNGLGYYRFSYHGSDRAYVGVMAQEVQIVRPDAVVRGNDGYLRVSYGKLGVRFQSYEQWLASGARVPGTVRVSH